MMAGEDHNAAAAVPSEGGSVSERASSSVGAAREAPAPTNLQRLGRAKASA